MCLSTPALRPEPKCAFGEWKGSETHFLHIFIFFMFTGCRISTRQRTARGGRRRGGQGAARRHLGAREFEDHAHGDRALPRLGWQLRRAARLEEPLLLVVGVVRVPPCNSTTQRSVAYCQSQPAWRRQLAR